MSVPRKLASCPARDDPQPLAQRLLHTDPPSTALAATQVIWQFFAAHPH
jgi:hypothetical protein